MSLESALPDLILAGAGVSAMFGTRVHWNGFPQGVASPACALFLIAGPPIVHMAGVGTIENSRVQIDVRDPDYADAVNGARLIFNAIKGFKGVFEDVYFQGVLPLDRLQDSGAVGATLFHRVSMDFAITWRPA